MLRKLVPIQEAAQALGVSAQKLLDGVKKAVEASQC